LTLLGSTQYQDILDRRAICKKHGFWHLDRRDLSKAKNAMELAPNSSFFSCSGEAPHRLADLTLLRFGEPGAALERQISKSPRHTLQPA
jgi:hypothetical protein